MPTVPLPVCRRPGCALDAVAPHGFCHGHDLHYARWRTWRDQLDTADLADTPHRPDDDLPPGVADALDTLHRHLTPGPWSWHPAGRTPPPR